MPTKFPDYPWQKVGTDLFVMNGTTYLLIVDYFSRYPEVVKLTTTTSSAVIAALKPIFASYGVPETLMSDNGPQYASQEFAKFADLYGFTHITSSPQGRRNRGG